MEQQATIQTQEDSAQTHGKRDYKCLFVVFVIGERYINNFNILYRKSLEAYCKKYNYDLIVRETFISKNSEEMDKKKFFWERLLIPNEYRNEGYDFVVSIDSDIYISSNAPPLPLHELGYKIGAVNERKIMGTYEYRETIQRRNEWKDVRGRDWYALSGDTVEYDDHINGGLVVYRPEYHADIMMALYHKYIGEYKRFYQDDQSVLSHFLMENDMVYWLDDRFNRVWFFWREMFYPCWTEAANEEGEPLVPDMLKMIYMKNYIDMNYFCHLTGGTDAELLLRLVRIEMG